MSIKSEREKKAELQEEIADLKQELADIRMEVVETRAEQLKTERRQLETEREQTLAPQKSIGVAYVLLIIFGGMGLHRFYLERIGSGVVQFIMWVAVIVSIYSIVQDASNGQVSPGWSALLSIAGLPLGIWVLVDLFLIPGMARSRR